MERDVEEKSKRLAALNAVIMPKAQKEPAAVTPKAQKELEEDGAIVPAKKKSRRRRWKKKPGGSTPAQEPTL
jgi:hypothetical protein